MTDDFRFDITSDRGIEHALAVAFTQFKTVTAWAEGETQYGVAKLLFAWSDSPPAFRLPWPDGKTPEWQKLPAPLTAETVQPLIIEWLKAHPADTSGIDTDGSVGQGWRIRNTDKHENWSVMFTVEPWACEYSK